MLAASVVGTAEKTGGGMTLAAGYEFHHKGNFAMDFQLRATHASLGGDDDNIGVDMFVGLVGLHWY